MSVTAPEVSRGIAERKRQSIIPTGVRTVVTDNPGCVLHLRGVFNAAGEDIDVLHPAEIVARQVRGLQ